MHKLIHGSLSLSGITGTYILESMSLYGNFQQNQLGCWVLFYARRNMLLWEDKELSDKVSPLKKKETLAVNWSLFSHINQNPL